MSNENNSCGSSKIRVVVVEDSSFMRDVITSILNSAPSLEVVGEVQNGEEGLEKIVRLKPDVITINLQIPVEKGLKAIRRTLEIYPVPMIVVSSMELEQLEKSLSVGAMDYVSVTQKMEEISGQLIEKVKISSRVKPFKWKKPGIKKVTESDRSSPAVKVVAIGVSTGGPQALQKILSALSADFNASILIVQHISTGFIEGLTGWLRHFVALDLGIAGDGDLLVPGKVLFAPDDYQMRVTQNGVIRLSEDITHAVIHKPSIDIMMKSVAEVYKENSIGVIMTGMGADGVEGLAAIRSAGGRTIAQDEKTSAIFGMNKKAIESGYADQVIPLENIANTLMYLINMNHERILNKMILIIDDSPSSLNMMKGILGDEGFKTVGVETGEEGVEKAKNIQPDLILVDTLLPGMDGFEVCRKIKESKFTDAPKIIIVTGSAGALNAKKAREVGADAYCAKTYDCSMMLEEVKKILK